MLCCRSQVRGAARPRKTDPAADLNDGITGDVGWTVFEVWGMNDPGQVIGFGTAVLVGIYHQRG
jgi:hypothetical protein